MASGDDISYDDVVEFIREATYDDLQPSRYDELMRRAFVRRAADIVAEALDETFGDDAAAGFTKLDELYELGEHLATQLVAHPMYLRIRGRVKSREGI